MDIKYGFTIRLTDALIDALDIDEESMFCAWYENGEIHVRIEDEQNDFAEAFSDGYEEGAAEGYGEGHAAGYNEGLTEGYQRGFRECLMKYPRKNASHDEEWRS